MTESQRDLLNYLSTRKGVVPVPQPRLADLYAIHDLGYVATNGNYAQITPEGVAALTEAQAP